MARRARKARILPFKTARTMARDKAAVRLDALLRELLLIQERLGTLTQEQQRLLPIVAEVVAEEAAATKSTGTNGAVLPFGANRPQ